MHRDLALLVCLQTSSSMSREGFAHVGRVAGCRGQHAATYALQVRVLLKEPKGREVNDGDRFTYNAALTEKLYRIKINSIQLKETVEENKKTNSEVMQDRQYQVSPARVAASAACFRLPQLDSGGHSVAVSAGWFASIVAVS